MSMTSVQSRPASFQLGHTGHGQGMTIAHASHNGSIVDTSAMGFDDLKNNFGMLLGKPLNGIAAANATTEEEFLGAMDVYGAYKKKEWKIFGTWMTAQLLNAKNRFLPAIISPIFETPEINFTIEHTSISAMPYTEIAPCGIPEEPNGAYTYSWKEGVRKYEQGRTMERDLMLDPNFGAQYWLQMLASFVGNARLTIDMGIITTAFQIGYENIRRARTEGAPIDHHKQYLAETAPFFLAAVDPEQLITFFRNLEEDIPGLDTLIFPHGKSNYLRDVHGDSQTMLVEKLSTDYLAQRVMIDFVDGPDSFKTIRLGDRPVNVIEFTPFYIGNPGQDNKGAMRVNPFMTNVTIGQFHPPSPFITCDGSGCERAACSDILTTSVFNQSKTIGAWVPITMRNRMENCVYYDKKTGKVSQIARDFARLQTKRRSGSPGLVPWDWNHQNHDYIMGGASADINIETTSNSVPNMTQLNGVINKKDMRFRDEFVGILYNVSTGEFIIPPRFGDFHLRSIPNDYIKLAAEYLEAKFREEYGVSVEEGFVQIRKLVSAIRHTPWTDRFLFALLNKNVPKMIAVSGTKTAPVYKLVPEKTQLVRHEKKGKTNKHPLDQCQFPDAEVIEEVKTNRFGGWDLPDKDGNMTHTYPPGFDNAVGIQTLAQEALKGNSLWQQGAREALEAVLFVEKLHKFVNKYVGKSDVVNPRYLPVWIPKSSGVTMLLDTIIKSAGPVHIGITEKLQYVGNPPIPVSEKSGISIDQFNDSALLAKTVDETRTRLEVLIANKAAPKRVIISNVTRALACLSNDVYVKFHGDRNLLSKTVGDLEGTNEFQAEIQAAIHKLYDYAIGICSTSSKNGNQHKANVESISIIMDSFVVLLEAQLKDLIAKRFEADNNEGKDAFRRDVILPKIRSFVTNFGSVTAMKKFLNDERKSRGNVDYGVGFHDALNAYEKRSEESNVFGAPDRGEVDYEKSKTAVPIYNINYNAEDIKPSRWLRAPLASSQALRDYLRDKLDPWILPSDYKTFYAYPEDHRIVTGDSTIEVSLHKNKFNLCSLARSSIFQCRLNSKKGSGSNGMDVEESDDDNNDFFSSLSAKSKKTTASSFSMGSILKMGKKHKYDEDEEDDDPYYRDSLVKEKRRFKHYEVGGDSSSESDLNASMAEEYPGPWKARLAYKHKEITTKAGKFFFDAIIQSKNRAETPIKLSGAGAVILDVMIARPFIEVKTSAILAMKAGSETMLTTIGHSHVQVTKESRGCWHINVGFMMGVIKIQPNNIALIPHAFPESLIGGKNVNFMTDFRELRLPNPTKPSMIGILLGPDERKFEGLLHITNGDTMVRPSYDYAIHLSKHSAGDWMEHVLGPQTVQNIDIAAMGRETYASCLSASNILSLGPTQYINPRTNKMDDIEGNGPMGTFNMNMPGVQDVYEGKAHRFPDRIQMYAYQNSS